MQVSHGQREAGHVHRGDAGQQGSQPPAPVLGGAQELAAGQRQQHAFEQEPGLEQRKVVDRGGLLLRPTTPGPGS